MSFNEQYLRKMMFAKLSGDQQMQEKIFLDTMKELQELYAKPLDEFCSALSETLPEISLHSATPAEKKPLTSCSPGTVSSPSTPTTIEPSRDNLLTLFLENPSNNAGIHLEDSRKSVGRSTSSPQEHLNLTSPTATPSNAIPGHKVQSDNLVGSNLLKSVPDQQSMNIGGSVDTAVFALSCLSTTSTVQGENSDSSPIPLEGRPKNVKTWSEILNSDPHTKVTDIIKKYFPDANTFKSQAHVKALCSLFFYNLLEIPAEMAEFIVSFEEQVKKIHLVDEYEKMKLFLRNSTVLNHRQAKRLEEMVHFMDKYYTDLVKRGPGTKTKGTVFPFGKNSSSVLGELKNVARSPPVISANRFLLYGREERVRQACTRAGLVAPLRLHDDLRAYFGNHYEQSPKREEDVLRIAEEMGATDFGKMTYAKF